MNLLYCMLLLISDALSRESLFVDIKIPQGVIRGISIRTYAKRDAFAFMGIPYATPPINHLRFKPSVPHPGWSQVLETTTYRSGCPQLDFRGNQLGSEDCLFLNVFTPSIRPQNSFNGNLYPVMVYIQAESFENGDSALYGPEKLLDKQVVVVTFNYRLGILGFLSTEDDIASGNWGLHDQKLALEWIRNNIGLFNGDANSVTVFGQGAGAASVVYHVVSPLSQGLFHRAIAQSGSALCEWAIQRSPLLFARDLAQSVGCPTFTNTELIHCLRKTNVRDLLKVQSKEKLFGEFPQRAAPVIERFGANRFMPDDPKNILNSGNFNKIPLMMGINKDETSYFYPLLIRDKEYRRDAKYIEDTLLPRFLDAVTRFKGGQQNELKQTILYRYFNGVDTLNISDIGLRFINMSTDSLYTGCIDETLKFYSQHIDAVAYMYVNAYKGHNSLVNLLMDNNPTLFDTGVCHGDELFYLFDLKINGKKYFSSYDVLNGERLLTLWTDFAKFGKAPQLINYEYPNWERFDGINLNYYRIGNDLRPERAYRQSEAYFWSTHLPALFGISPHVQPLSKGGRQSYQALAWSMVAVSLSLLLLIVILLTVLYYQRKSQSFRAHSSDIRFSSRISDGSSALY